MYTIDDFKTKRIAASFGKNQAAERSKFLINCEEAGIKWYKGCEATKFQPSVPCHIACAGSCPGYLTFQDEGMPWWFPSCGITVVPCNDFDFMQPATAPRYSIHITSDGDITHCIYKIGDKVVKRTKATRQPEDTYDFLTGAQTALSKLNKAEARFKEKLKAVNDLLADIGHKVGNAIEKAAKDIEPTPAPSPVAPDPDKCDKEKREAKAGEWILVTNAKSRCGGYKNGSILKVAGKYGSYPVHPVIADTGEWFEDVVPSEYVVLVPKPAAPEYDEVIRPAKVGEKIKTVAPLLNNSYYEKDEIFTVDNKKNCCSDSVRVKGAKIPVDKFPNGYLLWPSEYVVLVPRNGTR